MTRPAPVRPRRDDFMTIVTILVSLGLFVYLLVALLRPEWF